MRRVRNACVLVTLIAVLLSGCGNGPHEETRTEPSNGSAQEAADSAVDADMGPAREAAASVIADVDEDGVNEQISLYIEDRHGFTLTVGDQRIAVEEADHVDGELDVVNLKSETSLIAVPESGPSGDDATWFFAYRDGEIARAGRLQGKGDQLEFSGDGMVTSKRVRGEILHTWFHDQTYRLTTQYEWEPVAQDLYEMNTPVKALVELTMHKSRTDASVSFTLHPGDEAVIQACDDREWCLVQKGNQEGWFAVDDFNTIRGLDMTSDQVFEGLSFAD